MNNFDVNKAMEQLNDIAESGKKIKSMSENLAYIDTIKEFLTGLYKLGFHDGVNFSVKDIDKDV